MFSQPSDGLRVQSASLPRRQAAGGEGVDATAAAALKKNSSSHFLRCEQTHQKGHAQVVVIER